MVIKIPTPMERLLATHPSNLELLGGGRRVGTLGSRVPLRSEVQV